MGLTWVFPRLGELEKDMGSEWGFKRAGIGPTWATQQNIHGPQMMIFNKHGYWMDLKWAQIKFK